MSPALPCEDGVNWIDSLLAISVEALCSPLSSISLSPSPEDSLSLSLILAALFRVVPITTRALDASPSVADSPLAGFTVKIRVGWWISLASASEGGIWGASVV